MLVRIFKTNQIYIYAFIPIVLIALRWTVLFHDAPFTPAGQLPFLSDFFAWLSTNPWLSLFLGIVAIFYQGHLLAEIVNQHRLIPYSSNLIVFILVVCYSVLAPQNYFSPIIFSNVFSVLALFRIMKIHNQGGIYRDLFRVGIYISLGTMIYLPSSFMLLIVFYDLVIIRTFQWREYLIPVIGIITPYLYLLMYYFLRNESEIFFNYFIEPKTFLSFLEFEILNWMPFIIMSVISAFAIFYLYMTNQKRTVRQNNLYKVIAATLALSLILSFVYYNDFMSASGLIWPSLSIILVQYLMGLKRRWIQESIVYLLLFSIVVRDILSVLI